MDMKRFASLVTVLLSPVVACGGGGDSDPSPPRVTTTVTQATQATTADAPQTRLSLADTCARVDDAMKVGLDRFTIPKSRSAVRDLRELEGVANGSLVARIRALRGAIDAYYSVGPLDQIEASGIVDGAAVDLYQACH